MIVSVSEFERIALNSIEAAAREKGLLEGGRISVYPDILANGLIRIEKHANGNNASTIDDYVVPGQIVGLLPLSKGISLWVNPKVPIGNIDFMAKRYGDFFSPKIKEIRRYYLSEDTSISLWEKLAEALVALGERIAAEGIWHEYVQKENLDGGLVGRINASRTINQFATRNIDYRVATTYFIREMDIPSNRVLREALQVVSQKASSSELRRRARHATRAFQYTSPANKDDFASLRDRSAALSRSRPLYSRALPIAEAVLFNEGLDSSSYGGWLAMDTLFIKMDDLFEKYVRTVLESALGSPFTVRDGNRIRPMIPLFENGFASLPEPTRAICSNDQGGTKTNNVAPDIVIERDGKIIMTPDVKYKPIKGGYSAKRGDIEQSITYAHRLGLNVALTIHPCIEARQKGLHYSGRIGSIHVFCYCIDLGTNDLATEERDLANSITTLLQQQEEGADLHR